MNKSDLVLYSQLLADIKERVRHAQQRAILSANAEMILMYWDVGRMIASRQQREGWGAKVIPRLAVDLKNELPEEKGFSPANLKRMVRFWSEYPEFSEIGARAVRQIAAEALHARSLDGQKISAPPVRQLRDRTEYSLRDIEKPIGVADYELTRALPEKLASSLPSIEDIKAELSRELADSQPQGASRGSVPDQRHSAPEASALPLTGEDRP
jgi:hypothetical protein